MFIDPVPGDQAVGPTAEIYEGESGRWGFLPDFVRAFSHRPEAYSAWLVLIREIYGGIDRRRCELATLSAAKELRSTCCGIAHGKMLSDLFYTEEEVVQIATDHHNSGLEEVDVAIMDFAAKAARDASSVTQDDVDVLRGMGLSDKEITDVVLVVAARAFFATMIEALGTRAETPMVEAISPELREALAVGRPLS